MRYLSGFVLSACHCRYLVDDPHIDKFISGPLEQFEQFFGSLSV